jgi:hypothetical protein
MLLLIHSQRRPGRNAVVVEGGRLYAFLDEDDGEKEKNKNMKAFSLPLPPHY